MLPVFCQGEPYVDFEGQYVLNKRTFSPQEAMLIPKLPEW